MVYSLQVINKITNFVKHQYQMPMNENNLVVLREYDSVNDAEWDRSILEGEGIYAMIRNEIMSALYPTGVMPAQLVVRYEDRVKAESVLSAYSAE